MYTAYMHMIGDINDYMYFMAVPLLDMSEDYFSQNFV